MPRRGCGRGGGTRAACLGAGAGGAEGQVDLAVAQPRHQVGHLRLAEAVRPSGTPHGPLTEPYALYLFGIPADPAAARAAAARQRALDEALPVRGRKPLTFLNSAESAADAFVPAALDRLRGIKHDSDPRNTFRGNFPVAG
ncbi:hypothetical protein [Actinomadura sp. GTD37]|uniref:hypothetical protein n=1 Tax=Actinomadura sp. GTD37 TaxID=1778030 RepID=UPI0035BF7CFE